MVGLVTAMKKIQEFREQWHFKLRSETSFARADPTDREWQVDKFLIFFIQKGLISIPQDETGKYLKTPFDSAYRATLRWLSEFGGYKRGKRNNIVPRADQVAKRHYFLREFFKNRQLPAEDRLREVYTDESYIHEHYSRHEDSLWDPNDEQDVQVGKGIHRKEHIDWSRTSGKREGAQNSIHPTLPQRFSANRISLGFGKGERRSAVFKRHDFGNCIPTTGSWIW